MSNSTIRKSVADLTLSDLANSPVWAYADDEEGVDDQDETTVRPYPRVGPLDSSAGTFVVQAAFILADGTRMSGYLTPPVPGDNDLSRYQPVVITPTGQVGFWCGRMVPDDAELAEHYRRLGNKDAAAVFPLRFESRVPLKSGTVSLEIPGFIVVVDVITMATRVVQ